MYFYYLDDCFLRTREGVGLGGWGGGEVDIGGGEGGKLIRIYCMKKSIINKKNKCLVTNGTCESTSEERTEESHRYLPHWK